MAARGNDFWSGTIKSQPVSNFSKGLLTAKALVSLEHAECRMHESNKSPTRTTGHVSPILHVSAEKT
jgi:hypothetical protein